MRNIKLLSKTLLLLTLLYYPSITNAGENDSLEATEERKAEAAIKSNTHFIETLDPYITNFGDEKDKELYTRAIQRFMSSKIIFMKFQFGKAYKETTRTQRLLIVIYKKVIQDLSIRVQRELVRLSRTAVRLKQQVILKQLAIALRDIAVAKQKKDFGDNIQRQLLSNKIHYYVEAMMYLNHSLRFSILIRLKTESIYPVSIAKPNFKLIKRNLESGFPRGIKAIMLDHYTSYFKSFYRPSIKEKIWNSSSDTNVFAKSTPEMLLIEDPPVLDREEEPGK